MIIVFTSSIEDLSDYEWQLINEMFERMNVKMYNISYSILEDKFDAEEALSETFIKIINNIERISLLPVSQLEPYCVTILKNESINIIRNRAGLIHTDCMDYFNISMEGTSAEDRYLRIVSKEKMLSCIERLSYSDKLLIQLRFVNRMKFKDIGKLFNITEEAAKKRGQRILKRLKKYYKEGGGEYGEV